MTATVDATTDEFLGGRVNARQPRQGYRAGVDAVLLAAACPASPGETVLELGCGVGVVSLCLAARVPGVAVHGVEVQAHYAALAAANGVAVTQADLTALPDPLRQTQFHHVIFFPPYFEPQRGKGAGDLGRQTARVEETPLAAWFETAEKRLRAKGGLTVIHRAEALPKMLAALGPTMGSVEVLPLQPRAGRAAHLVLLRARKDGRAPFRLHAPVTLHAGDHHAADTPDYTPLIHNVLQNAAPLRFPD